MKKLLAFLLGFMLLVSPLSIGAEAADSPPADAVFQKAWLCGPHYGYRQDVTVLVLTNSPDQQAKTEAEIASEVRFVPFNTAEGLFSADPGEAAGSRAEITWLADDRTSYTLRLKEPGKYIISDAVYYFLDRSDPVQAALRKELDDVVVKAANEKDTRTAKVLHDWIAGRVSPLFPEEDAQRLKAACADPMNALLTGYACEEAYDRLFDLLSGTAGLYGIRVSGLRGEESEEWCLMRLDDKWTWTDMSMDDSGNRKSGAYFAKDDKSFGRDHTLCETDEAFVRRMIRTSAFDGMLSGDISASRFPANNTMGDYTILISEGPAYVVGESATVSFRVMAGKKPVRLQNMSPEEFLQDSVTWYPWDEENLWYNHYMSLEPEEDEEKPPITELVTLEEINEDRTRFTLTFHQPGRYEIFYNLGLAIENFYLISPDEPTPAAMAAEMDKAVETAKQASTEKAAAQSIFQWIRRRIRYNQPVWDWVRGRPHGKLTERDAKAAWDGLSGLIYGKTVCYGYAQIYHMLMKQAGLTDFFIQGLTQPGDVGHAWNLNRLDGAWTYTDVTWNRFAWTDDRMCRDHEPIFDGFCREVVFKDVMSSLASRANADYRSLSVLPPQLRYLPKSADGYGFPEKPEAFMDVNMELEGKRLKLKLGQKARILINTDPEGRGDPMADWHRQSPVAAEYDDDIPGDRFQVELRTDPDLPFVKRSTSQWILIGVENGQVTKTVRRIVVPDKKGTYPGYNPRYHYYEYDEEMRPAAAGWYMVSPDRESLEFRVFFDREGNAVRYEARYETIFNKIKTTWEGTPENPLTSLDGEPVDNPGDVSPRAWEPVWFE